MTGQIEKQTMEEHKNKNSKKVIPSAWEIENK